MARWCRVDGDPGRSSAYRQAPVDAAAVAEEAHGEVKVLAVEPVLEPFHRRKAARQLLAGRTPKGCSDSSIAANLRQRRLREDDDDFWKSDFVWIVDSTSA